MTAIATTPSSAEVDSSVESVFSPEIETMIYGVEAIMDNHNPERGYSRHSRRVEELVVRNGYRDQGMMLAARIHDAVALITDQPESDASEAIRALFAERLDDKDTDQMLTYAYGIALSAHAWEKRAEQWRARSAKQMHPSSGANLLRGQAIGSETDATDVLKLAIDDPKYQTKDANGRIKTELLINPGIRNVGSILDSLKQNEIDALALKALEVVDNIKYPNPNAPASQWQDIMEVLGYFAPALEFAGLQDLANEVTDIALQNLYAGTKELEDAKTLHEAMSYEKDGITEAIRTAVSSIDELEGYDVELQYRSKSIGSIAQSLHQRGRALADLFGARIIISRLDEFGDQVDVEPDFIATSTRQIQEKIVSSGFNSEHPEGDGEGSAFESMMGDNARPTGYQAVHTSFSLPEEIAFGDNGDNPYNLFFEVQVTSGQAHGYNQTGASPALYKARLGHGAQAEALQARAKLKPGELLSREHAQIIKQITIEVESFHARSEHFNDPNRRQVLSTNILLEMSTSEWLRQHSTALRFIYEADAAGRPDTVVTPTFINERDFMFLFEQLMPGMSENPDFTHAYELSKSIHTLQSRDRPGYDHFTGHVLASVLGFALKQASKSDFNDQIKHFDSVLITLLHDTPEDFLDVLNSSGKASEIPRVINKLLQIKERQPSVFYAILKMNKPDKLPGETSQQREDRYINSLPEITYPAKFFERMNSWRHDLENMQEFVMEGDDDGLEEAYVKAEKYIMKSIGVLRLMKAHGFAYEADWFIAQYALFGIDIEV